MKKTNRLIPLLLACLLLVTFFYNVPIASACEGCTMYDDPDWDPTYDPHPEFKADYSDAGKFGYLTKNVQVYDTTTNEWVQLNRKCKVEILVKIYMDDEWTYTVDFGIIYTHVPVTAISWTKPVDSEKVERHAYLNADIPAYSEVRNQWEQLNKGCWVAFADLEKSTNGVYTYTITFGKYGTYTKVPIDSIDYWDDGYTPFGTSTKKEETVKKDNSKPAQTAKKETSQTTQPANTEKSTDEKNKPSAKPDITVCTADRYRFFADTSGMARKQFPHNMILPVAFGELQMYLR